MMFTSKMLKQDKKYPIDVVKVLPKCEILKEQKLDREKILKNVVFQIILELRVKKRRPKLGQVLQFFKGKDKDHVAERLDVLFGKNTALAIEDSRYVKLLNLFGRLEKSYHYQNRTLDEIDNKLSKLINRKQKRWTHFFQYHKYLEVYRKSKHQNIDL